MRRQQPNPGLKGTGATAMATTARGHCVQEIWVWPEIPGVHLLHITAASLIRLSVFLLMSTAMVAIVLIFAARLDLRVL